MLARAGQGRLIAVAMLVAWLACPAASATGEHEGKTPAELGISRDDPWASVAAPDLSEQPLVRKSKPAAEPQEQTALIADRNAGRGNSLIRTLGALVGVVALIVLLAWGYRATAGMTGKFGLANGQRENLIHIVSRKFLSPRSSVALLKVGDHMVLVGIQGDTMRTLDVIDDPDTVARLAGQAESAGKSSSVREFRGAIAAATREYRDGIDDDDAVVDDKSAHITRVRERLQGTLNRLRALAERE